jgi:hypothetical protein
MVYPPVPKDKLVIIVVHRGRCIVARYRQTAPYTFEVERARNWQALEPDARAAAQAQVGALTAHEHLPCPQELAQRARWEA